jgi:hypothetical protein
MAAYQKPQDYVNQLCRGTHNWATHTFKAAFSNTAPNLATMALLADITQIGSGGGYTGGAGGGVALAGVTLSNASGTEKVVITDAVFTATGAVGPFRYIWIYNDTSASDNLVCAFDYGNAITMANGETFTLDFDGTNGLWQLA